MTTAGVSQWVGGPFNPAYAAGLLAVVGLCGWAAAAVPCRFTGGR